MADLPIKDARPEELEEARLRTAMRSPDHMKWWLQKSGRRYFVFDGFDLVEALWTGNNPVALQEFQDVLALYRHCRRRIPNGRYETQQDPMTGAEVQIPLYKDEVLEPEELDRAIRYLVNQLRRHIPDWSLDQPAL